MFVNAVNTNIKAVVSGKNITKLFLFYKCLSCANDQRNKTMTNIFLYLTFITSIFQFSTCRLVDV